MKNIVKILKFTVIGVFMGLCFLGGYLFGLNQEKNPKGNGHDFYVEKRPETASIEFSTRLIYHSTIQCPAIKDGISPNAYGFTYGHGEFETAYPYYFCNICMDDNLINMCELRIVAALP